MPEDHNYWYLASYPKSGNTWCRVFITELIRLAGDNPGEELNLNQDIETGAIAYYIAECHPDIDLIIKEGEPERALFLQWFHYLASTLQPDVMIQFHPEIYFPNNDQLQTQFRDMSLTRLAGVLDIIENNLSRGLYFCGSRRTIIDYLFVMQAVWPEVFPHKITDYPNISDLVERLLSRPAVKRVCDLHMEKRKPPISAS